jgi:vacuolar protein sorting-associated protein 54
MESQESLRANDAAVAAAVEAAHQRWVKLLAVRSALHAKLPLSDFAAVVDVSHAFMAATEAGLEKVGGAKGHALRAALHLHAKGFLDATHQRHMSRLATLLESEAWQATPVDAHFQATADWVAKGAEAAAQLAEHEKQQQPSQQQADADGAASSSTVSTSKLTVAVDNATVEAAQRRRKQEAPAHEKFRAALGPIPTRASGAAGEPAARLMVGGDGFHMVNSGLMVLTMLGDYLDVTRRLPLLSTEVVHRVAELLKLFNSRTCQVCVCV